MFVLTERFEPPEGFDLEEHLKERGESPRNQRIVVRFARPAYRRARPSIPAEIEEERQRDDAVDVTFYFENLGYVARWLLRFGKRAQVLEPDELRDLVREEALAMAQLHAAAAMAEK